MFKKHIKQVGINLQNDLMVIHRYSAISDVEGKLESMPEVFLTSTPYQCEVIITNVSPKE
jgi:hypothetical protein